MLSPANPDRIGIPIRSVTSIGTPHYGTPIADLAEHAIDLIPFPHLPFSTADPFQTILDKLWISRDGMRELKAVYCQQIFNSKYVDAPGVTYFSAAGSGRASFPRSWGPLVLFGEYLTALTGDANDGLVPVKSAQWGAYDRNTWPADHIEEAGYNSVSRQVRSTARQGCQPGLRPVRVTGLRAEIIRSASPALFRRVRRHPTTAEGSCLPGRAIRAGPRPYRHDRGRGHRLEDP
jgi:hypothetical protein